MRFRALACDYDGTLASEDRIGPAALAALEQARAAGLRLLLVTGRAFFELGRVCDRLDLFHVVVAENGAVIYVPGPGWIRDLAPPPSPRLLAELDRRGIPYQAGRVIVGVARAQEAEVRAALKAVGVSLVFAHNRAALMLLPAGISKATGVREAIRGFGLSFHDVLALGDAENDLEFFEACGFAGCPASAVPEARARADWVFPGDDGEALATAIGGPILAGALAVEHVVRHHVGLGWATETSEPVELPARNVNVLVVGDPGSGKSWLAGGLVERLVTRRFATCVIDPEGDYRVLSRLAGVVWSGVRDVAGAERLVAALDRDPAASVVADLAEVAHEDKLRLVRSALDRARELRARLGLPHWIVVDEAHYLFHAQGIEPAALDAGGKGVCLVTYRPSWLRPEVLDAVDALILARTARSDELAFLASWLGRPGWAADWVVRVLPDLPPGEFVLVRAGSGGQDAVTFLATPRDTPHVRHRAKYADRPIPPDRGFVFRRPDGRPVATADSLAAFHDILSRVEDQVVDGHARRHDFSRWVGGVFADPKLAGYLHKLEARLIRREIDDFRDGVARLIGLRYAS